MKLHKVIAKVIDGRIRYFAESGKEIILIDQDNVMADLGSAWYGLYNKDFHDDLTIDRVTDWSTHLFVKPECGMKLYSYLKTPGIFRDLKPLAHSQEVLRRLSEHFEIFVVSDAPEGTSYDKLNDYLDNCSNPADDKRAWLKEYFPFIHKDNIIFTAQKQLIKGSLLFDDAPHNLINFHRAGGIAVVMNYKYNTTKKLCGLEIPRVSNWLEFEKVVTELLQGQLV